MSCICPTWARSRCRSTFISDSRADSTPAVLTFEFAARSHRQLFPTFEGTLRTDPLGPSRCVVWFGGAYTPPLGALGRALDATVMHGIAQRTLTAFLSRVTAEAAAAVNAHERAAIRGAESF